MLSDRRCAGDYQRGDSGVEYSGVCNSSKHTGEHSVFTADRVVNADVRCGGTKSSSMWLKGKRCEGRYG